MKGFLRRPGSDVPLLVQAVGTLFSPPGPAPAARGAEEGVVVIARDLDVERLRAAMPDAPVRLAALRDRRPLACVSV